MDLLVRWLLQLASDGQDPLAVFVERELAVRFLRPSPRLKIAAPTIPKGELDPLPADLGLERTPRYAQRNCGRRPSRKASKEVT
jgi:hypothetical protein